LLTNGAFEQGLDRWLMYSDIHLAWRALNTPVQVFFEQGLLGVMAWLALGIGVLAGAVGRGRTPAAAAAAAVGFVIVACFDTLLDAPRIAVLLALVGCSAVLPGNASRTEEQTSRSPS